MREPRIAIVGAGPAGMFAADALTRRHETIRVDILDRSPTPYGLLRYGVAPDNSKIKSVSTVLAKVLDHPRVRFFGNVGYGTEVSWADLSAAYDATIFATGAPGTRCLGIPGEQLRGSLSAAEIVAWYNGYPGHTIDLPKDLRQVAVIGAGNVALDVARILARDPAHLHDTDVPAAVIERLSAHELTDVHVIARRHPVHARFSTAELRELAEVPGLDMVVDPADLELDAETAAVHEESRQARAVLEILEGCARTRRSGAARRVHLRFGRVPERILGSDRVTGLLLAGETTPLPVQLVVRSVGYRGLRLPPLPFDDELGIVPHVEGRVVGMQPACFYVAGWAKRGPSGVIGTNKADAVETVTTLLADLAQGRLPFPGGGATLDELLRRREVRFVSTEDWRRIDALEVDQGRLMGRTRVKITDRAAILACRA